MSHSSQTNPRRGFGLADAMILIGATGAALACLRKSIEYRLTFIEDGRIIDNVRPATIVGAAFAATWGVGALAIRLRPPRPLEGDWKSRPGFVACLAATVGCLVKLAALFTWGASVKYRFETWYVPSILTQLVEPAAMSVGSAWLVLAVTRTWRRERSWIDNLGIAVGLSWMTLYVFSWAALCLE